MSKKWKKQGIQKPAQLDYSLNKTLLLQNKLGIPIVKIYVYDTGTSGLSSVTNNQCQSLFNLNLVFRSLTNVFHYCIYMLQYCDCVAVFFVSENSKIGTYSVKTLAAVYT